MLPVEIVAAELRTAARVAHGDTIEGQTATSLAAPSVLRDERRVGLSRCLFVAFKTKQRFLGVKDVLNQSSSNYLAQEINEGSDLKLFDHRYRPGYCRSPHTAFIVQLRTRTCRDVGSEAAQVQKDWHLELKSR